MIFSASPPFSVLSTLLGTSQAMTMANGTETESEIFSEKANYFDAVLGRQTFFGNC